MTTIIDNEELETFYYVDKSPVHGRGLYARVDILKGEYMGTYDGPVVEKDGMHVLWVQEEDGSWCGRDGKNMLRFLNHSNRPHAEFDGFDLYALEDIPPGVEIMINYGDEF